MMQYITLSNTTHCQSFLTNDLRSQFQGMGCCCTCILRTKACGRTTVHVTTKTYTQDACVWTTHTHTRQHDYDMHQHINMFYALTHTWIYPVTNEHVPRHEYIIQCADTWIQAVEALLLHKQPPQVHSLQKGSRRSRMTRNRERDFSIGEVPLAAGSSS